MTPTIRFVRFSIADRMTVLSGVPGLLMAFIAYGRMVLKPIF